VLAEAQSNDAQCFEETKLKEVVVQTELAEVKD